MTHWRGLDRSMAAPVFEPSTRREALPRSEPRPTRTAETVTGAPSGTCPLAAGRIVRTIGGAGFGEGEGAATADGLATNPGEGLGMARNLRSSEGTRVGGSWAVAVGWAEPGTAPRVGRSRAGVQPVSTSARQQTSKARECQEKGEMRVCIVGWRLGGGAQRCQGCVRILTTGVPQTQWPGCPVH